MNETKEIVLQTGGDYLVPAAGLEQILATYQLKKDFIEKVLRDGVDYGVTPGTGEKPSLKKAGAEKMASFFGLAPVFEDVETVEDWTGKEHDGEPFFYYRQKCKLYRGERMIGSADGSCNSWEKKYRYRWVSEYDLPASVDKSTLRSQGGKASEFKFAIERAETGGQYGKPAEYWKRWQDAVANGTAKPIKRKTKTGREMDAFEMDSTVYAVKNLDVAEQTNTILKMAQKRALVAAVLIATNASEYFTQDLDDFVDGKIVSEQRGPEWTDGATKAGEDGPKAPSYEDAKAVVVGGSTGKKKMLGDMSRAELEAVMNNARTTDVIEAAKVVYRHDFNTEPAPAEQDKLPFEE